MSDIFDVFKDVHKFRVVLKGLDDHIFEYTAIAETETEAIKQAFNKIALSMDDNIKYKLVYCEKVCK